MERREKQRMDCKKEAEIIDSAKGDVICKVNLLNLSTGGVCCVSKQALEFTLNYVLKFSLSLSKEIKVSIQIVGQYEKDGTWVYSMKFTNITALEKNRIRNYIDDSGRENYVR